MKTVRSARESSGGPLRPLVLAIAGLSWLVEFVVVAVTVRTGLQVGVVIAGFSMMWFWLRSQSRAGSAKSARHALATQVRS
jgi:hypothetical protein